MPHVIWKGALSFSLIHIPVSLYAASPSAALDIDLLAKNTGSGAHARCG